jgi:1-acyl-sn-glycerol-3-phosphate acyltransferase
VSRRVPELPPQAPRKGSAAGRAFGRFLLWLGGWRVEGEFPDLPRMVIIAAPHSSGWDAFWGLAAKLAMGMDMVFMGKQEIFIGPLGWLLRWFGGLPVDRHAASGVAQQVASRIRAADRMWFLLAPEGTRRQVERWRSGFWHIAKRADVPVFCAWFHYPERTIGLGPLVELSDDMEADMARIRALYAPHVGKHRGV